MRAIIMVSLLDQKKVLRQATIRYIGESKESALYTIFDDCQVGEIGGFRVDRMTEVLTRELCSAMGWDIDGLPEIVLITMGSGAISKPHIHEIGTSLFGVLTNDHHPDIIDPPSQGANYIEGQLFFDKRDRLKTIMQKKPISPGYLSIIAQNTPHCFENKGNTPYYALGISYPRIDGEEDFHILPEGSYRIIGEDSNIDTHDLKKTDSQGPSKNISYADVDNNLLGYEYKSRPIEISQGLIGDFTTITGDNNPHYDPQYAQYTKSGVVPVPGLLQTSLIGHEDVIHAALQVDGANHMLKSVSMDFGRGVPAGRSVIFKLIVEDVISTKTGKSLTRGIELIDASTEKVASRGKRVSFFQPLEEN